VSSSNDLEVAGVRSPGRLAFSGGGRRIVITAFGRARRLGSSAAVATEAEEATNLVELLVGQLRRVGERVADESHDAAAFFASRRRAL
jgi:hypothetical protein